MRSSINQLMPDSCNILAGTLTSDGMGGNTEAWGTLTAGVACRVDYRSSNIGTGGREQITGGALLPYQMAVITLPYDTTVTPAHRIEVDSNVFSIQSVNTGQSWKAVTRCTCELVNE
jgi:head-tail adaptor